jgi:hypothetical protein
VSCRGCKHRGQDRLVASPLSSPPREPQECTAAHQSFHDRTSFVFGAGREQTSTSEARIPFKHKSDKRASLHPFSFEVP